MAAPLNLPFREIQGTSARARARVGGSDWAKRDSAEAFCDSKKGFCDSKKGFCDSKKESGGSRGMRFPSGLDTFRAALQDFL